MCALQLPEQKIRLMAYHSIVKFYFSVCHNFLQISKTAMKRIMTEFFKYADLAYLAQKRI